MNGMVWMGMGVFIEEEIRTFQILTQKTLIQKATSRRLGSDHLFFS